MAFFEILVLFSTYLCQSIHTQNQNIWSRESKVIHIERNFSLLNYKESSFHGKKIPSSKLTETLGAKGVTFDSLHQIF
jgi:hypothetical protein